MNSVLPLTGQCLYCYAPASDVPFNSAPANRCFVIGRLECKALCQKAANIVELLNFIQELLQFVFAAFKFDNQIPAQAAGLIDRRSLSLKELLSYGATVVSKIS